jgi:hypothetical protein
MDTVDTRTDGGHRVARLVRAASGLVCVAIHLLVVFLVTVFSRADDYMAELDVTAGAWIGIVFLPELVLLAGAGLSAASAGRPRLLRATIPVAYLSIAVVVFWALSSQDHNRQLTWLFETLFGTS